MGNFLYYICNVLLRIKKLFNSKKRTMKKGIKKLCLALVLATQVAGLFAKSMGMPKPHPFPMFTPLFAKLATTWQHHIYADFAYGELPNLYNVPETWLNTNRNRVTTPNFWIEVHAPIFSKRYFGSLTEIYPYLDYFRAWWPSQFPSSTDDGPVTVQLG